MCDRAWRRSSKTNVRWHGYLSSSNNSGIACGSRYISNNAEQCVVICNVTAEGDGCTERQSCGAAQLKPSCSGSRVCRRVGTRGSRVQVPSGASSRRHIGPVRAVANHNLPPKAMHCYMQNAPAVACFRYVGVTYAINLRSLVAPQMSWLVDQSKTLKKDRSRDAGCFQITWL